MKNKRSLDTFVSLDLADIIDLKGYIILTKSGDRVYVTEYRRLIEERILHIVENNPVLISIARGETVDENQLIELERVLKHDLAEGDLEVTEENLRRVGPAGRRVFSTCCGWRWIWTPSLMAWNTTAGG